MNPYAISDCDHETLHRRLHSHEVRRRVGFLGQHRMLTCGEALLRLQASGLTEGQALSTVRAQRELFYIQFIDVAYFPCFQWRCLWLRKPIGQSLAAFGTAKTKWQIALWFVDENEWLDGLRPMDLLDTSPEQVVGAAEWEVRGAGAAH